MRTGLVTTLKRQATELLSGLERDRQPIWITQHGVPSAYLIDVATYESLQQRMGLLEGSARGEKAIADYIALEDPDAARELVQRIVHHVGQLARHPQGGSKPQELSGWRYHQIVEPPCRVFYREDPGRVCILYVMRAAADRRLQLACVGAIR